MTTPNNPNSQKSLLKRVLTIDLVVFAIMLVIWLFIVETTITNLINMLIIFGILLMGAGGSYVGGSRSYLSDRIRNRSEKVVYSDKHIERDRALQKKQRSDATLYFIAGAIPLAIGIILAIIQTRA